MAIGVLDEQVRSNRDPCSVFIAHTGGRTLVRIVGELDMCAAPCVLEALDRLDGPLDVDCRGLQFIDGAGMTALLQAERSHGGLLIRNATPWVQKVVTIAGLSHLLAPTTTSPGW